ncbi:MAG: hypothetical protein MPN21_10990 [Thermoanaerobaculia bacterium]|nr:hypothetical protein [Thermoanaerobaculia bacterium]
MRTRIVLLTLLILALVTASSASAQTPPFTRTVVVNNTGSPAADGAALLSALSSLSPAPSYTNRWVIELEGGIYDVGTTAVVMQPYVSLHGSGIYTTFVRGSVGPVFPFLLGGLVEGASNSEIRDLTIQCLSNAQVDICQAMSLEEAHPRLTDLRIATSGTGTGSHWGIRTFNSAPILDRVQVKVDASASHANYGIVYGGSSTLNIKRSAIVARNATDYNWAILLREDTQYSVMTDTAITAVGGNIESAGIRYNSSFTSNVLSIDNTRITSHGATKSIGIGDDQSGVSTPRIFFRHGRLYGGTDGFAHYGANVDFVNTEVFGPTTRVIANVARVGGTWLRGGGTIFGLTSVTCAGTFDGGYTFYPSTCPP